MKITRRQIRKIIKEAIESSDLSPGSKLLALLEDNDSFYSGLSLMYPGVLEDASDDEKNQIARVIFNKTRGWHDNPPTYVRDMERDIRDYDDNPDAEWVISHSKAKEYKELYENEVEEWFNRSKAVGELLDIYYYDLTNSSATQYDDFNTFYKAFEDAEIF